MSINDILFKSDLGRFLKSSLSPSNLQNSLKVLNAFFVTCGVIFESFSFCSFTISSSVLEANLFFGVCAVVCAIVWSFWLTRYISLLAVQTGLHGTFKSIRLIQSGNQNFTRHGMFTSNLEYRNEAALRN